MEYHALTIGLSDDLFSGIQPLLSSYMRLIPSLNVRDASRLLEQCRFHLLIVDIEYLRSVNQGDWLIGIRRISFVPVIVLSDTPEADSHSMVQLGADICTSSRHPHSMIADLAQAQLRRYTEYNHYNGSGGLKVYPFQVGDIFIDPPHRRVEVRGKLIHLRPREFSLLLYFMQNPDVVLSSEQICKYAWKITDGYNGGVSHPVYLLRQQIEPRPDSPIYIQTVYGFGYRFNPNYVETCDMCEENERELSGFCQN